MDRDPELVRSSFSGPVTRQAVIVRLEIYRLEDDPKWVLEVVNERGTSIVWDDLFDTEGAAYEAFEAAVVRDGMHTFLDETNVVSIPTRH